MIGAMPAVAVRHERRRAEKRSKRPSQLYLGGPWLPPSPGTSPSPHMDRLPEYYLCGKVSALHVVVGSLLLGGVLLVVGLVQLSPGAEAAAHRYYILAAGVALIGFGLALMALRLFCIHCHVKGVHGAGNGIVGRVTGIEGGGSGTETAAHTVSSIEGLVTSTGSHLGTPPSEADALIRPGHPARDPGT